MADFVYKKFKEQILQGNIDMSALDIRCAIIDETDYTPANTHEFLSSIPAAAREEASGAMTTKTFVDGTYDADDVVYSAAAGDAVDGIVFYVHTGSDATARLIAYMDSYSAFPITLSGGDVTFQWAGGGIFTI